MAMTAAERQRRYRERKKKRVTAGVTAPLVTAVTADPVTASVTAGMVTEAQWALLDKLERSLRGKGKAQFADAIVACRNVVSGSGQG